MIEAIIPVILAIVATGAIVGMSVWVVKVCDPCNHSYERIDTPNDKKMILVCHYCGKIKKIRK